MPRNTLPIRTLRDRPDLNQLKRDNTVDQPFAVPPLRRPTEQEGPFAQIWRVRGEKSLCSHAWLSPV
jgi:hypothetical protein